MPDPIQRLEELRIELLGQGVTNHDFATELTYLIVLKMNEKTEPWLPLPEAFTWAVLLAADGVERLKIYRRVLLELSQSESEEILAVFADASTVLKEPKMLGRLVSSVETLDWFGNGKRELADYFDSLLEKKSAETKTKSGKYFTPRPLIQSIVALVNPRAGETVQDPASGSAGFLIGADRWVKGATDDLFDLSEQQQAFQQTRAFSGIEIDQELHRLALTNLRLRDVQANSLCGNTLTPLGQAPPKVDVMLCNPPFGSAKEVRRSDFTYSTNNNPFAFIQHIYRGLKLKGRAAVIVPDSVLFEESGREIRRDLMEKCNLHTILRLPTGVFQSGAKTNVLFFSRAKAEHATEVVWVYDLRTNAPRYGKTSPFTCDDMEHFVSCYGEDPYGLAERREYDGLEPEFSGVTGDELKERTRWRRFTRLEISERRDNLDISWIPDDSIQDAATLLEPDAIAAEIAKNLELALSEINRLRDLLE